MKLTALRNLAFGLSTALTLGTAGAASAEKLRVGASFKVKSLIQRLIELHRSYQGAKNGLRFGLR